MVEAQLLDQFVHVLRHESSSSWRLGHDVTFRAGECDSEARNAMLIVRALFRVHDLHVMVCCLELGED